MDKEKHLKYFKVENFKGLESFEMKDIGQFNLIVGDNNVGKTSILESLLFNEDVAKLNSHYFHAFTERNNLTNLTQEFDFYTFYLNKHKKATHINFEIQNVNGIKNSYVLKSSSVSQLDTLSLSKIQNLLLINRQNYQYVTLLEKNKNATTIDLTFGGIEKGFYSPMIFYNIGYRNDLISFYSEKIQKSKEVKVKFLSALKFFIPDIEDIEVVPSEIKNFSFISVRLTDVDGLIPLSMFGDGAIKLFRILLEIQMVKGERLMVDEIDTGVHYSRFKIFWKTIIHSAIENNVQIFATTHNLECLRYFKVALEEEDMIQYQKDARHFLVERLPNNEIKAFNYNFEQFESALDLGNEIRGGN